MYRRFILKDLLYLLKTKIFNTGPDEKVIGRGYIFFCLVVGLMVWGFTNFENNIKPTVIAMAEARAQVIAVYAVTDAINEQIVKNTAYNDIVSLQRDDQSRVTALQVNVAKVNQMQSMVSQVVQKKIEDLDNSELRVPLGNLLHSSILAGWGPRIKIRILPIGTVQSNFNGEFTTAGINQTRHKITLDIKGKISIMVPFISTTKEIVTSVPVAETVIVGNVPATYLDVTGANEEEAKKAQQIAPNLATMDSKVIKP